MAAKVTQGQVDVVIDGTTYTLRPSLAAAQTLSRAFGGLSPLLDRLRNADLDAYVAVVVQGAGLERRDAKAMPEAIWSHGVQSLMNPCTEFVLILVNGGRPLDDDGGEEAGKAGKA